MLPIISITGGQTRHPAYRMAQPVNFQLCQGETLVLFGPNGSGKSLLVDILTGAHPLLDAPSGPAVRLTPRITYDFGPGHSPSVADNVRLISFRDVYGADRPAYYQQRWNHGDEGHSPLHHLSSGELRKRQLALVLEQHPRVLIIDNPYIGLDTQAREDLNQALAQITGRCSPSSGLVGASTLVLTLTNPDDIPPFATHVYPLRDRTLLPKLSIEDFRATLPHTACADSAPEPPVPPLAPLPTRCHVDTVRAASATEVIRMDGVTIRYGERTILRDLHWSVRQGECWALTGQNGAGKSTLLSLVCADNPQAYAQPVSLFGQRRGAGHSIWDIKRHIGYVSPEIFSTFLRRVSVESLVASGLRDTMGLFSRPTAEELRTAREWLHAFEADHLAERDYLTLSSGEQRLALLVRAFVKCPSLLVLDEPFHGLDPRRLRQAQDIIDRYVSATHATLIMVSHYPHEFPRCINKRLELVRQA